MNVELVTATAQTEDTFGRGSYLGRSLERVPPQLRPGLRLTTDNSGDRRRGLPEIYNAAIENADPNTLLVFVHDDVYLNDWMISSRVREGLDHFDVVGLAGSVNPDLSQPSWGLKFDRDLRPDGWQLGLARSGVVNHFDYGCPAPTVYGDTPAKCLLLDGLFIAASAGKLQETGVRFDSTFDFHLYDLDFCRTATAAGLRLGTWPISVTHDSRGGFDTSDFRRAARAYLSKWDL